MFKPMFLTVPQTIIYYQAIFLIQEAGINN